MKDIKVHQQQSPTKLKTTQTILQNLYARATKPQKPMIQSYKEKPNYPYISTLSQKSQANLQARLQAMIPNSKVNSYQEPYDYSETMNNPLKDMIQQKSLNQHEHSNNCCIFQNKLLKSKISAIEKQQILLQSYRQQVQYLKKVNLLQTQQIDKLRRMIRIQQKKKYSNSNQLTENKFVQPVVLIADNDTKIHTHKAQEFQKNCKKKNFIRNSLGNKSKRMSRKGTSKKKQYI